MNSKPFFFWGFKKKNLNKELVQVSRVCFPCQLTTQPILVTRTDRNMPNRNYWQPRRWDLQYKHLWVNALTRAQSLGDGEKRGRGMDVLVLLVSVMGEKEKRGTSTDVSEAADSTELWSRGIQRVYNVVTSQRRGENCPNSIILWSTSISVSSQPKRHIKKIVRGG